jgi:hypothetical protein
VNYLEEKARADEELRRKLHNTIQVHWDRSWFILHIVVFYQQSSSIFKHYSLSFLFISTYFSNLSLFSVCFLLIPSLGTEGKHSCIL